MAITCIALRRTSRRYRPGLKISASGPLAQPNIIDGTVCEDAKRSVELPQDVWIDIIGVLLDNIRSGHEKRANWRAMVALSTTCKSIRAVCLQYLFKSANVKSYARLCALVEACAGSAVLPMYLEELYHFETVSLRRTKSKETPQRLLDTFVQLITTVRSSCPKVRLHEALVPCFYDIRKQLPGWIENDLKCLSMRCTEKTRYDYHDASGLITLWTLTAESLVELYIKDDVDRQQLPDRSNPYSPIVRAVARAVSKHPSLKKLSLHSKYCQIDIEHLHEDWSDIWPGSWTCRLQSLELTMDIDDLSLRVIVRTHSETLETLRIMRSERCALDFWSAHVYAITLPKLTHTTCRYSIDQVLWMSDAPNLLELRMSDLQPDHLRYLHPARTSTTTFVQLHTTMVEYIRQGSWPLLRKIALEWPQLRKEDVYGQGWQWPLHTELLNVCAAPGDRPPEGMSYVPVASASEDVSVPAAAQSAAALANGKRKKDPATSKKARPKVSKACMFCRRSHMTCDDQRPCSRCIKRDIAHLCRDESGSSERKRSASRGLSETPVAPALLPSATTSAGPSQVPPRQPVTQQAIAPAPASAASGSRQTVAPLQSAQTVASSTLRTSQRPLSPSGSNALGISSVADASYLPLSDLSDLNSIMTGNALMETSGHEFHGLGLSEFLKSLEDSFGPSPAGNDAYGQSNGAALYDTISTAANGTTGHTPAPITPSVIQPPTSTEPATYTSDPALASTKTERFLLTAADQNDGSRDERLQRVIHAKFEAGLLKPYDYVKGYTRLSRWMEQNMSVQSRQRTLQALSSFRPAFRAIASSLTDLDLVFIEEAFERLLLDYDRVFSTMGIPACLWRRTGEVYKGNKEFAELVGVPIESLREGRLAIYELMTEESAVHYWQKYADVAFKPDQKAVLTSCVLVNQHALRRKRTSASEAILNCCFSFTVRRDAYNIPSLIAGNFLPYAA
ncbi:uncharacterized protein L969DRAFT_96367 [Mixia osmundae IAM 14324]|uniref:Zn(2)-C6 fungal-type domain-containing protein n=1 Tax=Mixia osmundae (strain CBS 9802 / IAM 14324 / JCM 22182 / KY 12970) TaxID=764103 RepID=G7DWE6_MIXOS|nr:uncharacterized protein L969DRAFT_96367 [Mixia osmundae IAM 14324]KEI37281.1 hypothetical protein L969DRAFT_96367 [Mixia osmundae IAM 14324]GAA94906.1 hypothetical protein E5Q_01561 [Mixia osmundae IAM 14324]